MGLTQEQIDGLYARKRTRGGYVEILTEQLEGEENAFAAKETYPQLANKVASTLYQGFRNAAEKMKITDKVDILNMDDEVFVIFKDRVEISNDASEDIPLED